MEAASSPVGRFIVSSHLLPASHSRYENDSKFYKITASNSISHKPKPSIAHRLNAFLNKQRSGGLSDLEWRVERRRVRTPSLILAEYRGESAPITGKVEAEKELVEQTNKLAEVGQAISGLGEQIESLQEGLNVAKDNLRCVSGTLQAPVEETYAEPSERNIVSLKGTSEEKTQEARAVLAATELETAENAKNLTGVPDTAPAETTFDANSAEVGKRGAKIHDFCLGIPYGGLLVAGGVISFILTGSISAIRFGVILGGLILFSSVTSLKVWKKGESSMPFIKVQTAIAFLLFARDVQRFLETRAFFPSVPMGLASGAMLGFYGYVYFSGGNPPKKTKVEPSVQEA